MRVLQQVKQDDETKDEVMKLMGDPEEFHEVIAKAWQDNYTRWSKEPKPTWQHLERNYQHLCGTQQKMEMVSHRSTRERKR